MQISVNNLTYTAKLSNKQNKKILENINFEIDKGEVILIIGKTGSGKTCLVQQINGLLLPSIGSCTAFGLEVNELNSYKIRENIGFLFQNPEHQLFAKTVYEDITFTFKNKNICKEIIDLKINEIIGLLDLNQNILKKNIFDISYGDKKKVALAGILAQDTDVIILDEPNSALDYNEKLLFLKLLKNLKQKNKTIIIITHDIEEILDICDKVLVIEKGKIEFWGLKTEFYKNKISENFLTTGILNLRKIFKELKCFNKNINDIIFTFEEAKTEITNDIELRKI